jgi:hypothetical protein
VIRSPHFVLKADKKIEMPILKKIMFQNEGIEPFDSEIKKIASG